ncbi:MAG: sugar phosphate nucleotidyltransferase [Bacteroidetes bacterium]|nr:sugar phosphate nucleotidyltransferase [Bacteroidota bacterium]
MSKPRLIQVFISSTTKELSEYRGEVFQAINKLKGYKCISADNFTSQSQSPESYLQDLIPSCDLFIGVVGLCYGSVSKTPSRSFTELEYDVARAAKLPCLVFMTPEDFSLPGDLLIRDGGWAKQQKFRQKIGHNNIHSSFTNPQDLSLNVIAAILNWEQKSNFVPSLNKRCNCIILSGGYSNRLWPLTIDLSKHLLPVGGRPVLAHALDFVAESKKINNILLITNKKYESQIGDFYKEYVKSKQISKIDLLIEPESPAGKLGSVGAINYAIEQSNFEDLLLIAGDNIFGFKLDEFLNSAFSHGTSANAIHLLKSYEDLSEYGVVELSEDGTILNLKEKQPFSTFRKISTACYYLRKSDVERVPQYISSGGNVDSLGSLIFWLTNQNSIIYGFEFSSFWFDIGTREKLLQANWKFLVDHVRGEVNNKSNIKGPVYVSSNSIIHDSKIGPKVYIEHGVKVINSEIENSLILTGAEIRDSIVKNSVVGPHAQIEGNFCEAVCGPKALYTTKA